MANKSYEDVIDKNKVIDVKKKYDIIIIGYKAENTFEKCLVKELESRGHYVALYTAHSIYNQVAAFEREDYMSNTKSISLFSFFKKYYRFGLDFIIICQTGLSFINDIHIPVFYYHRELTMPPKCVNPTYIIMQLPESRDYLRTQHMPMWGQARSRQFVWPAGDPSVFNPTREKDLKGINYIGWYEAAFTYKLDPIWNEMMHNALDIPIWATEQKLCTTHKDGNVKTSPTFNEYRDYLERSEALLIVTLRWVYLTRRMIEAAMCKTLPILWIHNDKSEKAHNKIGFYHRKNCIMFREKEELETISWTKEELKEMTENAYNLVIKDHTYVKRADQLLAIFEGKL